MGWTVCCVARSGPDAMDLAAQMKPHVALMDVGLIGGMDGFQTAAELRSRYGIPSLLISGASSDKAERRAKEVSSMGILAKPFTPEALDEALRTCLDNAGG
jgi:CheY-like chemotaxis protein